MLKELEFNFGKRHLQRLAELDGVGNISYGHGFGLVSRFNKHPHEFTGKNLQYIVDECETITGIANDISLAYSSEHGRMLREAYQRSQPFLAHRKKNAAYLDSIFNPIEEVALLAFLFSSGSKGGRDDMISFFAGLCAHHDMKTLRGKFNALFRLYFDEHFEDVLPEINRRLEEIVPTSKATR